MPAIPHVTRRGAIYHWRRRMPSPLAESRVSATLVVSLRTSDSRRARYLAGQITALSDLYFMPAVMNQRLTQRQLQTIFRDVFTRHLDKLEAVAARERIEPGFNVEDSRRSDRVMGWVYRLLETRGLSATVDERARTQMAAYAMSAAEITEVATMLSMMLGQNVAAEPNIRLAELVEQTGGEANPMNLALVQETIYRAMAAANFQTERRYDGIRSEWPENLDQILRQRVVDPSPDAMSRTPQNTTTVDPGCVAVPTAQDIVDDVIDDVNRPQSASNATAQTAAVRREVIEPVIAKIGDHPIVAFGERLILKNARSESWDDKTQRQARQIYQLFGKLLLEQSIVDLAQIRQSHFAELDDLLGAVAKSYGKTRRDNERTTAELRAIGATKPASERGIAPETLNRHLTFLRQLLLFIRSQGQQIDRDIDLSLLRGKIRDRGRNKRSTLSSYDLDAIFTLPCFTGCKGWKGAEAFEPGPQIYHRALFFAIILLYYTGARREEICGLTVDDVKTVDAGENGAVRRISCIHIEKNEVRRIKNVQSVRFIALHEEVVRLGFLDYIEHIRKLDYKLVFPDLKSPTSAAPLGDRLYDEFLSGLLKVIPDARQRKKVIHSLRKTFGNSLKQAGVQGEIRGDIMGHGGETVTEEIYCDPIALTAMMDELRKLPVVTGHLTATPIKLLPWVLSKSLPPFSRVKKVSQKAEDQRSTAAVRVSDAR